MHPLPSCMLSPYYTTCTFISCLATVRSKRRETDYRKEEFFIALSSRENLKEIWIHLSNICQAFIFSSTISSLNREKTYYLYKNISPCPTKFNTQNTLYSTYYKQETLEMHKSLHQYRLYTIAMNVFLIDIQFKNIYPFKYTDIFHCLG